MLSPRTATALPIRSGRAVIYGQLPVPGQGGRRGCVGVTGVRRDLATPGIAHAAAATAASSTEAGWGGHAALMAAGRSRPRALPVKERLIAHQTPTAGCCATPVTPGEPRVGSRGCRATGLGGDMGCSDPAPAPALLRPHAGW